MSSAEFSESVHVMWFATTALNPRRTIRPMWTALLSFPLSFGKHFHTEQFSTPIGIYYSNFNGNLVSMRIPTYQQYLPWNRCLRRSRGFGWIRPRRTLDTWRCWNWRQGVEADRRTNGWLNPCQSYRRYAPETKRTHLVEPSRSHSKITRKTRPYFLNNLLYSSLRISK